MLILHAYLLLISIFLFFLVKIVRILFRSRFVLIFLLHNN